MGAGQKPLGLCWGEFSLEDMPLLQKTQEEARGQQNKGTEMTAHRKRFVWWQTPRWGVGAQR